MTLTIDLTNDKAIITLNPYPYIYSQILILQTSQNLLFCTSFLRDVFFDNSSDEQCESIDARQGHVNVSKRQNTDFHVPVTEKESQAGRGGYWEEEAFWSPSHYHLTRGQSEKHHFSLWQKFRQNFSFLFSFEHKVKSCTFLF